MLIENYAKVHFCLEAHSALVKAKMAPRTKAINIFLIQKLKLREEWKAQLGNELAGEKLMIRSQLLKFF